MERNCSLLRIILRLLQKIVEKRREPYYTKYMNSNKYTILKREGASMKGKKNMGVAPDAEMAYTESREALLEEALALILRLSPEQLAEIMGESE